MSQRRAHDDETQDRELLHRVAGQDRWAFERLLSRHAARIESICRRIVPESMVADVSQDVALQVWVAATTYRGDGTVAGWIGAIAHNRAVEVAVKEADRRHRLVTPLESRHERALREEPRDHALVDERDLLIRVMSSIDNVEDRYLFWRVYVDGADIASVASWLCVSVETAKSRLKRTKRRLRWMYRDAA